MSCEKYQSMLPETAMGTAATEELSRHLAECAECRQSLEALRQTFAVLDEWQAPEPSPFFDTRMQALLREERGRRRWGVFHWLRRPLVGFTSAAVLATGIGAAILVPQLRHGANPPVEVTGARGTAVGDLQMLDKSSDLLAAYDDVNGDSSSDN
jgi:predicted anti-sigma-YlaC factor YlaD